MLQMDVSPAIERHRGELQQGVERPHLAFSFYLAFQKKAMYVFSMEYLEYLKSTHWKLMRERFFKSKRFKGYCFICEKPQNVYDIHHKTYSHKGREKLQNLVALCRSCHHDVHFEDGIKFPLTPQVLNNRVYALRSRKKPAG